MNEIQAKLRPNIRRLNGYSSARDDYKGKEGIFLDANENPYGKWNRYPDPYQRKLKEKLAALKSVNTNNICLTNGSDEALDLAFRIFCEPGQEQALSFTPTYGMYQVLADINNVALNLIPLDSKFQIDTKNLSSALKDKALKLIFICSPNNPTGNLIDKDDIKFILDNTNAIVLIDEAYIDFAERASCLDLIHNYSNLIICQTFSKAWGLAGARVGVLYAQEEIIAVFNKVKAPYNLSSLNQQAILDAMLSYDEFLEKKNQIIDERRKLSTELMNLGIVKKIYPSDSNFLLVEFEQANAVFEYLIKNKLIVRNRTQVVPDCLRISVGTPDENQTLIQYLNAYQ